MLRYTPGKPAAVIDIGSNSLRMVIYDGLRRVPWPIFNEKVLCGLAANLSESGKLNPEGRELAKNSLARFINLAKLMGIKNLHLFATAAMRDATDGKAFVQEIREEHDISITVISGQEEARLAGYGVTSSLTHVNGVAGDLGGGSLELISLRKGSVSDCGISLPLGALRLNRSQNVSALIDEGLHHFPLRKELVGKTFYAVGGAFRNLAKIHMARKDYPLKVLHHYSIPAEEMMETLYIISRMSEKALIKLEGISPRRAQILPIAATIAEHIITTGKPRDVTFSVNGVREGFLYQRLPEEIQQEDPLFSGCSDMIQRVGVTPLYGQELAHWMHGLFPKEPAQQNRLRRAACILSEISRYENTEYRAELAYRRILDSSLIGISHADRVFMAKSVYHRYRVQPNQEIIEAIQSLLDNTAIHNARTIGYAMRLAHSLAGGMQGILPHTSLHIKQDRLILTLKKPAASLDGENVERRLLNLAELLKLTPVIRA